MTRSAASATRREWVTTTTVRRSARAARQRVRTISRWRRRAHRSARRRAQAAPRAPPLRRSRPVAAHRRRGRRAMPARRARPKRARARRPRARRRPAGQPQRERRCSPARSGRPQVAALEHDRDRGRPVERRAPLVECAERPAERAHLPRGRRRRAPPRGAGTCSSRARRSEDGDELAALDPKVEAAKRDRLDRAGAVELEDVDALQGGPLDLGGWPRARGRGSSAPPEALDHQPVRVDVVDALRRAEVDDRSACPSPGT